MTDNQELTEKELLPCPFCGASASKIKLAYDMWFIECGNACCTQQDYEQKKCIELWNTRAKPMQGVYLDRIQELKEQLTQTQQALDRAVEALEFYANPGDYKAPYTGGMGKLYFDCGVRAKTALTSIKE